MKKLFLCLSIVSTGLVVTSCVEKHQLVDEDVMPSWLGSSIYGELQNPSGNGQLQGTFNTYLRLVSDLGYAEVLNRTGSKTVFPANDEAFDRFFQSNDWGVRSYDGLSLAQKKLLLYSSMLDNALLTNMLSNVTTNDATAPGRAVKHATTISVIDTVTNYSSAAAMAAYPNNSYWRGYSNGVSVVMDGTTPMLVHFTPEYMMNNSITTGGSESDFAILMGGDYKEGDSYVFRNRIIVPNITCQNGYIHQVDNVVVPPGNMAQVMKNASDLTIVSHLFDRYAVPYYNKNVTNAYHDWYTAEQEAGHNMSGILNPDSIFEVRYLSDISQGGNRFNGGTKTSTELLTLDPGWNGYYSGSSELGDLAAMFVPSDEYFAEYFINGAGKSIMERYAKYLPVTRENLMQNIDCIDMSVVTKLLSNMMQVSFTGTVPSKFSKIVDYESGDFMDLVVDSVARDAQGNYDVRIANNGVIYVMKRVLSPNSYVAVSAPTLFNADMNVIKWIIENKSMNGSSTNPYSLGLDFYAYLLAMRANYALFLPTDEAFDHFYVDPSSLVQEQPYAVHYYANGSTSEPLISASVWAYDPETKAVGDSLGELRMANTASMYVVRSHLSDLMNYCTIVLPTGAQLGANKYYKTKHGGEVLVSGSQSNNMQGGTVKSGGQIDDGLDEARINISYKQQNGNSYAIDHLIQTPTQSVYDVLSTTPQFSKFFEICEGLGNDAILRWAFGYDQSTTLSDKQQRELNNYRVFTDKQEMPNCLNYNVRFFNMYNYTVYVPNNDAITKAQENYGLPLWSDVIQLYSNDVQYDLNDASSKRIVREMIIALSDFVRYHFQNTSVYADNSVESMSYSTFLINKDQINMELQVSGGNGKIQVTDATGEAKTIDAASGKVANVMARDFQFSGDPSAASYSKPVYTTASSFAVIHELGEPLYYNRSKDLSKGL